MCVCARARARVCVCGGGFFGGLERVYRCTMVNPALNSPIFSTKPGLTTAVILYSHNAGGLMQ